MALPAFRVAKVATGAAPHTEHYTVKAGEAFARGDVVVLDTNGVILIATDDEAKALGIAGADADPGEKIPVELFTPGTIFSGVNSGTAYAAAHKGDTAALNNDVATPPVLSVIVATAGAALFTVFDEDTTDDDRVLVTVVAGKSQAPGGEATPLTAV